MFPFAQAFENMLRDIQERYEKEKKKMDGLKMQGREKTAACRLFMGNRLMYGCMPDLYRQHGLLKE